MSLIISPFINASPERGGGFFAFGEKDGRVSINLLHFTAGNGLDRSVMQGGGLLPPAILPPLKGEVDFARRAKDERVLYF
ncbi:MAG: hypothetical protein IKJ82_08155 [Oscillospiraceae bacterium]|nr:hypothetical protein [Oscillospiraceae bacterium]